jgi:hypothetical protein
MARLARLLRSHKAALPSWLPSRAPVCAETHSRGDTASRSPGKTRPELDVRPHELDVADFQQQDKTGVTQMCKTINPTLNKLLNEVYAAEEAEDE